MPEGTMEPQACPRCQKSVHVRAETTRRPGYCPACGIRILPRAYRPAADVAIAGGLPGPSASAERDVPPALSYLGRLLRRMRVWRGGVPSPGEPSCAYDTGPLRWAFFVYTWFPIAACIGLLASLPAAVCALLAQEEAMLGRSTGILIVTAFLASVSLAGCAIWRRNRERRP
jgi:DNA-directed RNA polymerase subunit RPC12/RpoP